MSSGDAVLCFPSQLALASVRTGFLQSVLFPWEDIPEEGVIGPAERNMETTKITEHVTEGYHIDSLIQIKECYSTLGAELFQLW